MSAEWTACRRADATLIQEVCDLPIGVGVEERVNLADDRRVGGAELDTGLRQWNLERAGGPAGESDIGVDALAFGQRDIGDEEPHHALLLAERGGGIVPQAREIGGERQDLRALLVADDTGILRARVFVGLLRGRDRAQR